MKSIFLFVFIFVNISVLGNNPQKNYYVDNNLSSLTFNKTQIDPNSYHLFSHGKPGSLYIEGKWLNAQQIAERFRQDVRNKKELLIYGCNFAQGEKGLEAVRYLENALKMKISASDDVTGKDGDWELEIGNQTAPFQVYFDGNLQLDSIHYIQPLIYGAYQSNTVIEEYIYLSTPSTSNITVHVGRASGVGSPRMSVLDINSGTATIVPTSGDITFSNSTPKRITFVDASNNALPPGTSPLSRPTNTAGTIISGNDGGLILESAGGVGKFYANYRGRSSPQAGSAQSKGTPAKGKNFRWAGTPIEYVTTNVPEDGNMMSMMALEDNTVVTISNIDAGTYFINGGGTMTGTSFTRTLNKGESFVLYAPVTLGSSSIQDTGWLGAIVASDKDIVTTVGGLLQMGVGGGNRDIGLDQLVPVRELGNEFIVAQGNGTTREKVVIVATQPNTKVYLNGNGTPYTTLANDGDYTIVPYTYFNSGRNMFINVDKPTYVIHKIFGANSDPTNSMIFIPPLSCFGEKEVDLIPDANRIGTTSYDNTQLVVIATQSTPAPIVTNNGITLSPAVGPTAVTGNSYWVTYRYNVATTGGSSPIKNLKVTSTGTIQAELIGASGVAGYGGFYSGFGNAPVVEIEFENTAYDYPCTGTTDDTLMVLSVPGDPTYSYQWYKNGVLIPGATSENYDIPPTDTEPAEYSCIITLPGGCHVFTEIVVSKYCPCSKGFSTGTPELTEVGISTRTARTSASWPNDIPNGFITLESNEKGFVLTRMADPENDIPNPVDGMLVYDTDDTCLKLYDGSEWNCLIRGCNN